MNIIFLSELADKALIQYMNTKGAVVLLPRDNRFDSRISSHPDLVMTILDNTLVIDEAVHPNVFQQLEELNVPYVTSSSKLSASYPQDIAYNAVITKDYLLHKLDCTNPLLLQHCRATQKQFIHVKQGYTKCSTVVADNNTLITSDQGIYQESKDFMDLLLVQPGHVLLEGFDYGFLGGASGVIEDTVVFHGDLSKHPDYLRIKAFLEERHLNLLYFNGFPLTDIGSILVFNLQTSAMDRSSRNQKHVNIPIFISHEGCPNDCVFCNQRKITAKSDPMTLDEVSLQIETYSSTLDNQTFTELAFFGGSFTGINARLQENYLQLAYEYKKAGKLQAIRLSTRPDYISVEILDRLKRYEVDTIELGVQSLNEEVLKASNRGHLVSDVYTAIALIKSYGFQLGIQLMVGLPEDTKDRAVLSTKLAALLKPDFVRIYPTLVIKETQLLHLCHQGTYHPLSIDEAVDWTKAMFQVFLKNHIPVIRIGLQPTDLIAEGKEVLYGPFHPAFRQLVESAYFLDLLKTKLNAQDLTPYSNIIILCNPKDLSQVIGHKRRNMLELQELFHLQVKTDIRIKPMTLELQLS
jgi:radical SAM superfamily enzyme